MFPLKQIKTSKKFQYYHLAKPTLCPEIRQRNWKMTVKGFGVNPGSKRTFFCATYWEISGAQEITCFGDGQWSAPLPTCKLGGERKT